MDSIMTEVKPMRIPRPKFCCAKSSFIYPAEPPKDYLDLEGDIEQLKAEEGGSVSSASKVEELGRALKEKVKV